jgi:hypothetical protein
MRLTVSSIEVVLVGGGGVIITQSRYSSFAGAAKVRRAQIFQYANVIGAAWGLVSGEYVRIFSYETSNRDQVIKN